MGAAEASTNSGPVGIGGWLLFPIVGLAIILALGVFQLVLIGANWSNVFKLLANPEHELATQLILLWGFALYTAIPLVPAVLLLRKSRHFPWTYIAWMISFSGTVLVQAALNGFFTSIIPVVWTILWTPYLLMSTRVRNTFVN